MPSKRAWRKLVKKLQRKRHRQKDARERDEKAAERQDLLEQDLEYKSQQEQLRQLEQEERVQAERQQQEDEEAWLRREALAQRQFRLDAVKRRQEEAEKERLRAQEAQALEARELEQRKRLEEKQRVAAEAAAEFEAMMQRMHEYLDNTEQTPPAELQRVVDTQPGAKLCEFFTRTNACRFGHSCTFNHRRPMLARILLIRHFFTHPLLHSNVVHREYADADAELEFSELDLRADYDEFFADVLPELSRFGKVINFRAVRNTLPHLRGHVFVEYDNERSALRAFINLQDRFYAAKRLSVEFSNLTTWRGAVCGTCEAAWTHCLSLARKCPKGFSCGYLHLFRNPNNQYNNSLECSSTPRSVRAPLTPKIIEPKTPSWDDPIEGSRNWRWSESPEWNNPERNNLSNGNSRKSRTKSPIHRKPSKESKVHSPRGRSRERKSKQSRSSSRHKLKDKRRGCTSPRSRSGSSHSRRKHRKV